MKGLGKEWMKNYLQQYAAQSKWAGRRFNDIK